ncbi:MAG TPA: hypothetical protein ENK25_00790 [Bacteroidetes bacterium]|nr:hypothetical protein [Bacteroidota bacterium]
MIIKKSRKEWMVFIILLAGIVPVFSQGLFEQAIGQGENKGYGLNGYVRSLEWIGEKVGSAAWEQKSLYAEGALKLEAGLGKTGDAYVDLRFRSGLPGSNEGNSLNLREAYVILHFGRLSFRVGQQIDVWGRADSYNPTDNITPVNPLFHSPNPDDMRLGNFLFKGAVSFTRSLSLEGVWIPLYKESVLPVNRDMDPRVNFMETQLPSFELKNSGYAFRLNLDRPVGGISLSWFDGFEPYPGLQFGGVSQDREGNVRVDISPVPFREQVAGLDFETALGSFGLRGEFAWRRTVNHEENYNRAWPGLRYVVGVDRTFGSFTVLLQYVGHYVLEYTEPADPDDPTASPVLLIQYFNRMMFRQLDRVSHLISLHPSVSLLHDELQAEVYGEYNFTTKEYLIYPKVQWNASDMIRLSLGGNIFHGKRNTLYDMIRPLMNGVFLECRLTF